MYGKQRSYKTLRGWFELVRTFRRMFQLPDLFAVRAYPHPVVLYFRRCRAPATKDYEVHPPPLQNTPADHRWRIDFRVGSILAVVVEVAKVPKELLTGFVHEERLVNSNLQRLS